MAQQQTTRDFWGVFAALGAVVALVFGVVALARPGDGTSVTAGGDGTGTTTLDVTLGDLFIEPASLEAPAGRVVLSVTNTGSAQHDLHVDVNGTDAGTPMLSTDDTAVLDLGVLEAGTYMLSCHVPGHKEAGMEATLTVTGDGGTAAPADLAASDHGAQGSGALDWRQIDEVMAASLAAFPAETEGKGAQPLEPTVLPDGTKQFELTTSIVEWEVEPGKFVEAWTYNGTVPGPTISVDVGDRVRVIVHNELPISTDVHWHGVRTPFDQDGVAPLTQPPITPGTSFTYEFTAERPSVGMYHAHNHGHIAVVNGLLGAFLIGDMPLPPGVTVSQELPMVLSDAGTIGFGLNGKAFPATEPIVANRGDWILVHYMNEGLTAHPMHLHQMDQLVIAKDGRPLPQPYAADTINIAPGERYSVLIQATDPGTWVWHCHILTHAESDNGLFGMVTALVVQ